MILAPASLAAVKPQLNTVCDVGTGHVLQADMEALVNRDPAACGVIAYLYEEGAFIYLNKEFLVGLDASDYSQAFKDLYRWALSLGCKWLQLDRDGPEYDDIPSFEW